MGAETRSRKINVIYIYVYSNEIHNVVALIVY